MKYLQTIDISEFTENLKKQRIFIQAWPYIKDYINDKKLLAIYDEAYQEQLKRVKVYVQVLKELFREFTKENLPVVIIKGLVQSQILYGHPYGRRFSDIDLMTTEDNMLAVDKVLRKMGYTQSNHHADGIPLEYPFLKEPYSHETYPYRNKMGDQNITVEVARFCHGFNGEECARMLERAVPFAVGDYSVKVLAEEDMFVQNIGNTFWNCGTSYAIRVNDIRLGDYLELMLMIRQFDYGTDKIVSLIRKYHIEQMAAVVFANLSNVFPEEQWIKEIFLRLDTSYLDRIPAQFFQYQLTQPDKAREITIANRKKDIYSIGNKCFSELIYGIKEERFEYEETQYKAKYSVGVVSDQIEVCLELPEKLIQKNSFVFTITLFNNDPESPRERTVINLWNQGDEMFRCVGIDRNEKSAYFIDEGTKVEPELIKEDRNSYKVRIDMNESEIVSSDILAASLTISVKKAEKLYHEIFMNYRLKYGFAYDIPLFCMHKK